MTCAAPRRLFLGLWPPPEAMAGITVWQAGFRWPAKARPTAPEKFHVTLHFLGDVDAAKIDSLVRLATLPMVPFPLEFSRAEVWSNGIAVLEPSAMPGELTELHGRLGEALLALGLPVDKTRPYRPHITLGRHAQGAAFAPSAACRPVRWMAQACRLVESKEGNYWPVFPS